MRTKKKKTLLLGVLLAVTGISLTIIPSVYSRTVTNVQYEREATDFYEQLKQELETSVQEDEATFDLAQPKDSKTGVLYVPDIGLTLPIYRGEQEENLLRGCGTLLKYGDITGEVGTHPVVTAHNGMPGQILFTNLHKMKISDSFYVLNETGHLLNYEVEDIYTVLPTDAGRLGVTAEMCNDSYLTLLTCTPEGINSHRLLVRGRLIELSDEIDRVNDITAQSAISLTTLEIVGLGLIILMIAGSGIYYAVGAIRKRKGKP